MIGFAGRRITCAEREELWAERQAQLTVGGTFTDPQGFYGEPQILTEWLQRGTEDLVLTDVRWPNPCGTRPDARPCEHWVPDGEVG